VRGGRELSARREVVSAMQEVNAASENLKRFFERTAVVTRRVLGQIEGGGCALDVADSMGLADHREALNEAIRRLEMARHKLHRAMFRLAAVEGKSSAEIGRVWRVSRQLVSRMIKE
jgi:DNA-directed RNA polymerase specialized sigma24 family protein